MALDDQIGTRVSRLLKMFSSETGENEIEASGANLIRWLDGLCANKNLSETTAKCYRRWLAAFLESIGHSSADAMRNWIPPNSRESALLRDELAAQALSEDQATQLAMSGRKKLLVDTSNRNSRYLTYVGEREFKALLAQLVEVTPTTGQPRYKGGELISLFFVVSAMTGLRPYEWPSARLLDSHFDVDTKMTLGPVLEVKTLKQSNRREDNPLKPTRLLLLDRWPLEQVERLRTLLEELSHLDQEQENGFDLWYANSRKKVWRAWKRVSKNHDVEVVTPGDDGNSDEKGVTFYSARHVFAEEVRRSYQYTRFEMAAMLGHSLLTNQTFYGPRTTGASREFSFVLPRPWPGDADDIMRWDEKVNPIRLKSAQGSLFGMDDWHPSGGADPLGYR